MDTRFLILGLILALALLLTALRSALRRRKLRKQGKQQPGIYEVGSPEYNAQIVGALRQVNERLALDGKRVPERVAIDIIQKTNDLYGKPED